MVAPPALQDEDDALVQENALKTLAQNSRRAAIGSLVGGVIVVAALIGSAWQVAQLQTLRGDLEADIDKHQTEIVQLEKKKDALLRDILALREANTQASRQIKRGETVQAQATLQASVAAPIPSVSPAELARVSVGRIYFQVRSDAQYAQFKTCAPALVSAGYKVPGAERMTIGPKRTELRYFHAEEQAVAQKLQGELQTCLGQSVALSYAKYPGINPLHFEVWMGPPA
jgi:hypothetical protein